ncbi:MAG: hypothetical protein AAF430_06955 [Myxococcota bacterium]
MSRLWILSVVTLSFLGAGHAGAQGCLPNCSLTASEYLVREDCSGLNAGQNCFESLADLTGVWTSIQDTPTYPNVCSGCSTGWLWSDRAPSESDPVTVDIGPGDFETMVCPENTSGALFGHVHFKGSGIEVTRVGVAAGALERNGINMRGCEGIHVSDLTAIGHTTGVLWTGKGDGVWDRVNMLAVNEGNKYISGWTDNCDEFGSSDLSYHVLHGVTSAAYLEDTFAASSPVGYSANCSKTWFDDGSIISRSDGGKPNAIGLKVHNHSSRSVEFIVAHSTIEVRIEEVSTVAGNATGLHALATGQSPLVMLKGTSIEVKAAVGESISASAVGIDGGNLADFRVKTMISVDASGTATEIVP